MPARQTELSPTQAAVWTAERVHRGPPLYPIPVTLRLRGPLHHEALARAFAAVVARHDVLRMCFPLVDGRPMATPASGGHTRLVRRSLQDEPDPETEARSAARRCADAPFDLTVDPPVRADLLTLGPDDHVLFLTFHHIAVDWWSVRLVLEDLAEAYRTALTGNDELLPPSPPSYWDWARARPEASEDDLAYWRHQLEGCPLEPPLATDHRRRSWSPRRGALVSHVLDEPAQDHFRLLCRRTRATPFVVALALVNVVLARIGDRGDVVVGAPFANREDERYAGTVGLFSTMHLLRTAIEGDAVIGRVVAGVRDTVLDVFDHPTVSLANLADVVGGSTGAGLDRLPVAFQLLHGTDGQDLPSLPGLHVERFGHHGSAVRFELELQVYDTGTQLTVDANYAADLFEPDTVERLVRRFERVLTGVVAHPDRAVGDVDVLLPEERLVIAAANDTRLDRDDETAVSMFRRHAEERADQPAIVADGTSLSYAQLDAGSGALAEDLRDSGVGVGDVVGVAAGRTVLVGIAYLAVLRVGAVLLPIDAGHPVDRVCSLLHQSGARAVIDDGRLASAAVPPGCHRITDVGVSADLDRSGHSEDRAVPGPPDPAYLIYTSGTTGHPKGVLVDHRSLANLVLDPLAGLCHHPTQRCSSWASPSFDVSVQEILSPLARGGVLVVVPEDVRHRAVALFAWLVDNGIESAYLPPFHVPALASWLENGGSCPLRHLMVGVEPISSRALATIVRHAPDLQLVHGYGPAEATVCATATVVSSPPDPDRPVPIGRPITNVRAAVLDRRGRPLPPGATGELHLMGTGLALGYQARPSETAAAFVPHGDGIGARAYRTGDRARWSAHGELEFMGRQDRQVKVRGMRVELAEVEHAVRGLPGVRQAVAIMSRSGSRPRLVAFVVLDDGAAGDPADLTSALASLLPAPMLPSAVVPLPELPLSPAGKIDRHALEELVPDRPAEVTAGTDTDEVVRQAWCEVLGLGDPDDAASFFECGGDSLKLIELVTVLAQRLHVDQDVMPLDAVYEEPTLAALQRIVARARQGTPAPAQAGSHLVVPLSPGPGTPLYLVHPIGGDVSCYAELARALDGRLPVVGIGARPGGPTTLPDTATSVANTVRHHAGAEGCFLAGWSYGGIVALAAAQRLVAAGAAPRAVVLLDAVSPSRLRAAIPSRPTDEAILADLGHELAVRAGPAAAPGSGETDGLRALVEGLQAQRLLPPQADLSWARRYAQTVRQRLDGLLDAPDPGYDGDVVLVLGSPGHPTEHATIAAWRAVCPHLIVERTKGDHVSMLAGDHARATADAVLAGLGRSARRSSP